MRIVMGRGKKFILKNLIFQKNIFPIFLFILRKYIMIRTYSLNENLTPSVNIYFYNKVEFFIHFHTITISFYLFDFDIAFENSVKKL